MRWLVLLAAGCNVCGEFSYRDYTVEEHCGVVYGAQGFWDRDAGIVGLSFTPTTPIGRPGLSWGRSEPSLTVEFPDEHLRAGTEVPADALDARCRWSWEAGEHGPAGSYIGPAVAEVTVRGRGFNPDLDPLDRSRYQRFTWSFDCADGGIVSTGTDVIELERRN